MNNDDLKTLQDRLVNLQKMRVLYHRQGNALAVRRVDDRITEIEAKIKEVREIEEIQP